jgi:DNA-binding protein YbaB
MAVDSTRCYTIEETNKEAIEEAIKEAIKEANEEAIKKANKTSNRRQDTRCHYHRCGMGWPGCGQHSPIQE